MRFDIILQSINCYFTQLIWIQRNSDELTFRNKTIKTHAVQACLAIPLFSETQCMSVLIFAKHLYEAL